MNKTKLRFVLPSLLGVLVFLIPVPWDGRLTIGVGIVTRWIKTLMGGYGLHILVGIMAATCVLTVLGTVFRGRWLQRHDGMKELFDVDVIWLLLRLLGLTFGLIYLFQVGPELLKSEGIGGAILVGIGVNVIAVWVASCTLLPLLTDFGFMEFAGTLARPVFRKVFQLPGHSAIDAITSFVGASSIGLLITIGQYEHSNYTARQACVIATNFSVVSIPFCLVVSTVAGIEHLFISWYVVVVVACLVAALITPRLPPLSRQAAICFDGRPETGAHDQSNSQSLLSEAWMKALERAEKAPGTREFFATGLASMVFFAFSILAAAMAMATLAALLALHTPIFGWLGYPFIGLLELAQLPTAAEAAPALFSGYVDQYMPAVVASGIESELTSFVLAGLSVTQLIFMSELGVIILRSSLPLGVVDLVWIFLLRTVIVLPILVLGAHLVVG